MITLTGLEPHPVMTLPSVEEIETMGATGVEEFRKGRLKLMLDELEDPFVWGYEPPIWGLIDDLLVDGREVELVGRDGKEQLE